MEAAVDLVSETEFMLRRVILLYSAGAGLYVSPPVGNDYAISAPARVDGKGRIEVGAYEPVTMEFVQSLAKGLGVDLPREVLPANVLCRTEDVIVWWTPPGKRTLFFTETNKLADLSGEDFPVPALVWRLELKDNRLFVRAIAGADRPGPGAKLYVAPFLNVYNEKQFGFGLVCQGTMKRPKVAGVGNLQEWEDGFFNAAGGTQLTAKATAHKGHLVGLWRSLVGKAAFPEKQLVSAEQTLKAFVEARK